SGKVYQKVGNQNVGVAGITVSLTDVAGNVLATTVTDSQGRYSFSNQSGPAAVPGQPAGGSSTGSFKGAGSLPPAQVKSSPGTIVITNGDDDFEDANFRITL